VHVAATPPPSRVTAEGLGALERPHPVQAAFIAEQAAQCSYSPTAW
jgi:nicotinate dehydrogenase subunit A